MKQKKSMLLAALALAVAVCLMGMLWLGGQENAVTGGKNITVTVVHADGTQKDFAYATDAEYLGEVLLSEGLAEGEPGLYGLTIHTVDGETASWEANQSYWALYIGQEYATTGADGIVLTDGGDYSLVYTLG